MGLFVGEVSLIAGLLALADVNPNTRIAFVMSPELTALLTILMRMLTLPVGSTTVYTMLTPKEDKSNLRVPLKLFKLIIVTSLMGTPTDLAMLFCITVLKTGDTAWVALIPLIAWDTVIEATFCSLGAAVIGVSLGEKEIFCTKLVGDNVTVG